MNTDAPGHQCIRPDDKQFFDFRRHQCIRLDNSPTKLLTSFLREYCIHTELYKNMTDIYIFDTPYFY